MSKAQAVGSVLLGLTISLIFWRSLDVPIFISEDGRDYIEFATSISSGSWGEINQFHQFVLRSPLYPIFIALSQWVFGWSIEVIRLMHALAALTVIALASRSLNHWCDDLVCAFCVVLILTSAGVFFFTPLTEWTAICLCLLIFCALSNWLLRPSYRLIFIITLLCSIGCCLRAALLPALILPFIAVSLRLKAGLKLGVTLLSLIPGLIPIVALLGFNLLFLDYKGLAPLGGINLLGVATLVGAPKNTTSSIDLNSFIERFKPISLEGLNSRTALSPASAQEYVANKNMWQKGIEAKESLGWSYIKYANVAREYAQTVIVDHLGGYLKLVGKNWLKTFRYFSWLEWLLVCLGFVCLPLARADSKLWSMAQAVILLGIFHLIEMLFCMLADPPFYRLVATTMFPLDFSLLIFTTAVATSLRRRRLMLKESRC